MSVYHRALQRIQRKKLAYRFVFLTPNGVLSQQGITVLSALAKFCGAYKPVIRRDSLGKVDEAATVAAAARLEIWQRIQGFLHTPDHEAVKLALSPDDE